MRVFVSDLHGHVGRAVRRALADSEHDVVGTIQSGEDSPGKVAETAEVRRLLLCGGPGVVLTM